MISNYLKAVFDQDMRSCEITKFLDWNERVKLEFDIIGGTGISGIMAVFFAEALGKPFFLVRKDKESIHASTLVEIDDAFKNSKILFVDDLCCTGKTFSYFLGTIKETIPLAICVGSYLYNSYGTFFNNEIPCWWTSPNHNEWYKFKNISRIQ